MQISITANSALQEVEFMLQQYGKILCDYLDMPSVERTRMSRFSYGLLLEETMFDIEHEIVQGA